jgi:hypothetical protein
MKRFKESPPTTTPREGRQSGQSLVEFILVMPILILVMVAGGMLGYGTYQAHMASTAIQEPAMQKLQFSNNKDAIPMLTLLNNINNSNLKATLITGTMIDNVQIIDSDPYTSIMVGGKDFQSLFAFIPGFHITVGQIINHNVLQAANAGSAIVHSSTSPWVPGGTPVKPPWE